MNGDTLQTIIVAAIVVFAAVMLWRSLRRGGDDCCDSPQGPDSWDSCGRCPLKDNCRKPQKKDNNTNQPRP